DHTKRFAAAHSLIEAQNSSGPKTFEPNHRTGQALQMAPRDVRDGISEMIDIHNPAFPAAAAPRPKGSQRQFNDRSHDRTEARERFAPAQPGRGRRENVPAMEGLTDRMAAEFFIGQTADLQDPVLAGRPRK